MRQPRLFTASSLALLAATTFLALPARAQTSPFILNGAATPNNTVVTASGASDVVTTSNGTFDPSSAFSDSGGNTSVVISSGTTITVVSGNQAISLESGTVNNYGQVTTTGGGNTAIVILSTPATVTNQAGALLSGGSNGVAIQAGGTVTNYGTITGSDTDGVFALTGSATVINNAGATIDGYRNGVDLEDGGMVTNAGTITGTDGVGIQVLHATGTVTNTGIVAGIEDGIALDVGGTITNSGAITGTGVGGVGILALANSSTVTNYAGGVISGPGDGISLNAGGSVTNSGSITSSNNTGVFIGSGAGSVINNAGGVISGPDDGISLNDGGTVVNSGTVTSSELTGVLITGGIGSVTNNAGASISGPNDGVDLTRGGTVVNSGAITSSDSLAVLITGGTGSVTNNAGGMIQGNETSVELDSGGTVYNAGQIINTNASFFAVHITGGGGTITNAATGTITSSNDAIEVNSSGVTVTNYGTVTSADRYAIFGGEGNDIINYGTLTTMEGLNTANPAYNAVFIDGGTFTNVDGIVNAPSLYYAVQFSGSDNTANIGNFSRFNGSTARDLFGGGESNEVLNFNFVGGTVDPLVGTAAYGSLTAQGYTYTFQAFSTVNITSTTLAALGATPNETAIGGALDNAINLAGAQGASPAALIKIDNALSNIYAGNPGAVGSALSELSPEKFAAFTSETAFNNASFETQATDSYLNSRRFGPNGTFIGGNGNIDASGMSVNDPNYDPQLSATHSRLLAWNPAPVSNGLLSDVADPVLAGTEMQDSKDMKQITPVNDTPWNVFVRGNVVLAQGFSQADVPHFDDNSEGVTLGADYRFTPNFLFGLTASYEHTDATLDTDGSSATVDSYSPGLYASYADHGWYANFSGNYLHNAYTQTRDISFLGQTANSAPEGNEGVVNLDGGYDFHHGALTFGPLAGLQYTHLAVDGYDESGSAADLAVNEDDSDSLRSRLGGRLSYIFCTCGGISITPHLDASWQHDFLDQSRGITSQFTGFGGGSFSVNTPEPSRDSALIDAGLDADLNRTVTVFVDYETQAGSDNYFGQSVQAGVKIGF